MKKLVSMFLAAAMLFSLCGATAEAGEGGSAASASLEDDLNPFYSGEWLEKETQFTILDVTKNVFGGWIVELTSPVSHGAWVIRANAYYDSDEDGLVYTDGVKYDLTAEGTVSEEKKEENLRGSLKRGGDEEHMELIWKDMEEAEGGETVFERAPALPAYVYPGSDEIEGAVANWLASGSLGVEYLTEPGYVTIPVVSIYKTDMTDDTHAKAYGAFWVLNYVKRGQTLECVSGGEHTGIASLEKDDQGWKMTGLEEAGDGDDYSADLERFADGDQELLQKYFDSADLGQGEQKEIRTKMIRDYVEANGLGISAYHDYGWEPVELN